VNVGRDPVAIAYDGSAHADAAVRSAVALFPDRPMIVVSVWEPGLALAMAPMRDPTGGGYIPPSAEEMATVDRAQHDHATEVAEAGVRLARELGADAVPAAVADELDIAGTITAIAQARDACAVVVGWRGRGAFKSRLFGSTTHGLIEHFPRPVVVVKAED